MSSSIQDEIVTLQSNDGAFIKVGRLAAQCSILIRDAMMDIGNIIVLPNVDEIILRKVMDWCEYHKNDPPIEDDDDDGSRKRTDDIAKWDQEFMQVGHEVIFEIIWAADYLDIKPLLELGCKTIANMVEDKSPDQIRQTFNIPNNLTRREEEIRSRNGWSCMRTG